MTTRSEQVAYLIELMAFDAQRELGRKIDHSRYYDFALSDDGETGYFKELSQTLCDSGRTFAKALSDSLMDMSLNYETGERFVKASQDFMNHLDSVFTESIGRYASEQADPDILENWTRMRRLGRVDKRGIPKQVEF